MSGLNVRSEFERAYGAHVYSVDPIKKVESCKLFHISSQKIRYR